MRIYTVWERMVGKCADLTIENRAYNSANIIVLVVLSVFEILNIGFGIYNASITIAVVLCVQLFFLYLARIKGQYKFVVIANAIFSYIILGFNFYFNSGVAGPTLFASFLTFQFLIAISVRRQYKVWLILHISMAALLMGAQYYYPHFIKYSYSSPRQHMMDLLLAYISTLLFTYFVTVYLRRQYDHEKNTASIRQQAVEEQIEKVKHSENILRAFFDSSGSSHILLGRHKELLAFNHSAKLYMIRVYDVQLKLGESMIAYLPAENVSPFCDKFFAALKGDVVEYEVAVTYLNGIKAWWYVTYDPARDDDGNIIGVAINSVEITARRLQEERIKEKNERLMKIAEIQSHEYRRPVATILGLMNMIKEDDYKASKEYLQLLEEAVKELDEKIHKAVNYTKDL